MQYDFCSIQYDEEGQLLMRLILVHKELVVLDGSKYSVRKKIHTFYFRKSNDPFCAIDWASFYFYRQQRATVHSKDRRSLSESYRCYAHELTSLQS